VPAAHAEQPAPSTKYPATQPEVVHELDPAYEVFPDAHAEHALAPSPAYELASHIVQPLAAVAPVAAL
jgi:hypothetical protein